jgi:putative ABC transport system substrate-binding protein
MLGSAVAVLPCAARAQQSISLIGFLRSAAASGSAHLVAAMLRGLGEVGFVEGQNATVVHRYADGNRDRLSDLAADLVLQKVAVIIANNEAARAAKKVTATVPIVFVSGADPVRTGLVASFNRPGGNVTGVIFTTSELTAKRLGLLLELVPNAKAIGVLLDPNAPSYQSEVRAVDQARTVIRQKVELIKITAAHELPEAFTNIVQAGTDALLVGSGPFFLGQRGQVVALAAHHKLPASFVTRQYPDAGGLVSYGASQTDAYRQAGLYAGRILKGEKPAHLPVMQPVKFDLVINLKTAKMLGLEIPPMLLARADEVIE